MSTLGIVAVTILAGGVVAGIIVGGIVIAFVEGVKGARRAWRNGRGRRPW
jgi:hypothetical protein